MMTKLDYRSRLNDFTVLKNKFDQYLFKYGPTLLLAQFCITLFTFLLASDNPFGPRYTLRWFEVIFFLFALIVLIIEVFVARDFFDLIPRTFQEMTKRNIIKGLSKNEEVAQKLISFLNEYEGKLNNHMPLILGGVFEAVILITNQRALHFPIIFLPKGYPLSALVVNFITLILPMTVAGYAMSVAIWKCFVTGYYVHRFSSVFDISVQPTHPDKAGGLKPIGDLIFSLALMLIVASLALSFVIIARPINEFIYKYLINVSSLNYQVLAPAYLYSTIWFARVSLGIVLILSLFSFFLPIISTHRRMRTGKVNILSSLTEIGNKISQLEKQTQKVNMDYKQRDEAFAEIASLSKVYEIIYKTPVWPFDRDILIKFFTPQVISLLSLLGVIQPIIDVISSWVK